MSSGPVRPSSTLRAAFDLARGGRTVRYGEHPDQVCELRLPGGRGPHPVAVVLHGGSWGGRWTRHTTRPLAGALLRAGLATWNVEYRRTDRGGGWPQTLQDVGDGIDALAGVDAPVDLTRVVLVGHSAGGQLALFAAARERLPADFPAARPQVLGTAFVGLAPVLSLFPAASALLGATRAQAPERWRYADPSSMLPIGLPSLIVHGTADRLLPAAASARFVTQARRRGDDIELATVEGLGHAAVIDPRGTAWPPVADWLLRRGFGARQSPEGAATASTVAPSANSSQASTTLPSGSVQ